MLRNLIHEHESNIKITWSLKMQNLNYAPFQKIALKCHPHLIKTNRDDI